MSFVSSSFLLFIAAVVLVYFITPKKFRWVVLLLSSYFFYWVGSQWLILVHFLTALFTWGIGLWIYKINSTGKLALKDSADTLSKEEKKALKEKTKKQARAVMWLGIVVDLGILLFLKYWNFFIGNVNPILRKLNFTFPELDLLLPLGISFYTLQAMAYMIDISRGKIQPDRNPLKFMLFMSFFPQIVQGPIPRYSQLAHQLYEGHSFDFQRVGFGIQLMLWGWFKKMVIADRIAIPISKVIDDIGTYHGLIIFFSFALYGIQIYTDFSGGMDIVRGFAQMVGIDLELNFTQPYFSRSIEEFWRRWHITLGSWMRDYVFYPLSLSKGFASLGRKARKIFGASFGKKLPSFLAMFIVYFLVGIWHGSSYKYIAYGLWNGIFIMAGIMFEDVYEKARQICGFDQNSIGHRIFQIGRTFIIVSLGRYFSRAYSFKYAVRFFKDTLVDWKDLSFLLNGTLKELGLDTANWILLFIAVLVLFFVDYIHEKNVHIRETLAQQHPLFRWAIYTIAILSILIFGIYGPGYDAASFIYEQF